jgi:hypothetical protein
MRLSRSRIRLYTSIYCSMIVFELSQFLYSARLLGHTVFLWWSLPEGHDAQPRGSTRSTPPGQGTLDALPQDALQDRKGSRGIQAYELLRLESSKERNETRLPERDETLRGPRSA